MEGAMFEQFVIEADQVVRTGVVASTWEVDFVGWLQAKGVSVSSVKSYLQDIRVFARWFEEVNGQALHPSLVTGVDLRAFRTWQITDGGAKPSTWNRRRSALAQLCRWALEAGHLSYDPFQGVDVADQVELPPRWLERGELQKVWRQVELAVNGGRTAAARRQALRDGAVFALMALAGLREGEVVGLDLGDVEVGERKGRVVVRMGKGEKRRELPLSKEARRWVEGWLGVRGEAGSAALFLGRKGERLGARDVQRMVGEFGRRAGVEVTPHALRHTFAKRLLDEGAPLTVVQKLLGHSRLETTSRYVQPGWSDFERAVERI
jgi:integrase/recombinase XerC